MLPIIYLVGYVDEGKWSGYSLTESGEVLSWVIASTYADVALKLCHFSDRYAEAYPGGYELHWYTQEEAVLDPGYLLALKQNHQEAEHG
jgi:hypothetical protein